MLFLKILIDFKRSQRLCCGQPQPHNHNVHGSNRSHFAKTPLVNLFYSFLNIKYFYIHWGLNPVFEWPCYSASFGKFKWAIFCSKIYPYVPRYLIAITGFQMFRSLLLSFDWMSLETTKNGFHFSINPSLIFAYFLFWFSITIHWQIHR